MTLIAISCQQDQAHILTDTAAYTANLRHMRQTTKIHHLHHLDAAFVSGGLPEFSSWARFTLELDERFAEATFDELVQRMPAVIAPVWRSFTEETQPAKGQGVLFLVGYSLEAQRFEAYEFGSDDDFTPHVVEGTYMHPTPWRLRPSEREYRLLLQAYEELGAHPDVVADIRDRWLTMPAPNPDIDGADLVDLARETREDRSMGGGIPIAGRLTHTSLRRGRAITRSAWTFPSSGADFERFVQGTDHPVAQAADCWCGSGLNILQCCRAGDLDKPCRCHSGAIFKDCCMVEEAKPCGCRSGKPFGDCCMVEQPAFTQSAVGE